MCVCVCVCEREGERERGREGEHHLTAPTASIHVVSHCPTLWPVSSVGHSNAGSFTTPYRPIEIRSRFLQKQLTFASISGKYGVVQDVTNSNHYFCSKSPYRKMFGPYI